MELFLLAFFAGVFQLAHGLLTTSFDLYQLVSVPSMAVPAATIAGLSVETAIEFTQIARQNSEVVIYVAA